ncbi:MAG: hypothetical protein ACOC0M_11325 [Halomonas sp.]
MTEADPSLTDVQRDWLRHARACDEAGTTMRAYATEHGLNLDAFYTAKGLLRRKGVLAPKASRSQPEPPRFAKARVVDGRGLGRCRVVLPSGLALEVDAGTDPAWVAALVGALA